MRCEEPLSVDEVTPKVLSLPETIAPENADPPRSDPSALRVSSRYRELDVEELKLV